MSSWNLLAYVILNIPFLQESQTWLQSYLIPNISFSLPINISDLLSIWHTEATLFLAFSFSLSCLWFFKVAPWDVTLLTSNSKMFVDRFGSRDQDFIHSLILCKISHAQGGFQFKCAFSILCDSRVFFEIYFVTFWPMDSS